MELTSTLANMTRNLGSLSSDDLSEVDRQLTALQVNIHYGIASHCNLMQIAVESGDYSNNQARADLTQVGFFFKDLMSISLFIVDKKDEINNIKTRRNKG